MREDSPGRCLPGGWLLFHSLHREVGWPAGSGITAGEPSNCADMPGGWGGGGVPVCQDLLSHPQPISRVLLLMTASFICPPTRLSLALLNPFSHKVSVRSQHLTRVQAEPYRGGVCQGCGFWPLESREKQNF